MAVGPGLPATIRRMSARTVAVGLWILAVCVRAGAWQDPPASPMRSTTSGVYVAAQADAGQKIFEATCIGGCHNMASHKGIAFKQRWDGQPLWDLFDLIFETMPKDDPGSLTDKDAAGLVAYLLKLNGLPAGKDALPTDETALRKIKIDLPAGTRSHHAGGPAND